MNPQASCKYNGHGYNDDGVCIYCKEAMKPAAESELRDKVTDICFKSAGVTKPQVDQIIQACKEYALGVVGEDTNSGAFEQSSGTSGLSVMDSYQNALRAKQRLTIEKGESDE